MLSQADLSANPPFAFARNVFGWALLIAGAIGLALPVIPGVPLLIAGATLLGPAHPVVRTWKARIAGWRKKGSGVEKSAEYGHRIGGGKNGIA